MMHTLRSRGQATVEFALVLPLLLYGVLVIIDTAWLAVDQCIVYDAARTAARAAVVDSTEPGTTADNITRRLLGSNAHATTSERDGLISVSVSRRHDFLAPIVSRLLPRVTLDATSTMLMEPRITTIGG